LEKRQQYLQELKNYFWENNLSTDQYQLERLAHFADLVVKKNEKLNLISRRDVNNIIEKHVFVSSFISEFLPEKINSFLDLGTGGGFPGIPLAITHPLMHGVLADSTGKKIDAVR
jgi:16S rRNA (guanine527-N7)-methyltransferase